MTSNHNVNYKLLPHTIGSIKHSLHVGQIIERVNFLLSERQTLPAILRFDFRNQFAKCIYPKTRLVDLIDAWTVPFARHYGKQRSATTTNSEIVCFP